MDSPKRNSGYTIGLNDDHPDKSILDAVGAIIHERALNQVYLRPSWAPTDWYVGFLHGALQASQEQE
jgi:hypothetical protein